MLQGIWRELGPLIVLAHLPELLSLLLALGGLATFGWLLWRTFTRQRRTP